MKLRAIVTVIVGFFSLVAIIGCAISAREAWDRYQETYRASLFEPVNDLLLVAAGQWAVERGASNSALADVAVVKDTAHANIHARRAAANKAFDEALTLLAGLPDFPDRDRSRAAAAAARAQIDALRTQIDSAIVLPKSERPRALLADWFPAITQLIMTSQDLRLRMVYATFSSDPVMQGLINAQYVSWMMSEFAGRERATIGAAIAAKAPLLSTRLQLLGSLRGNVEFGRTFLLHLVRREGVAPAVRAAVERADALYFSEFEEVRDKVYAASIEAQPYPIDAAQWIAASTKGIDSLLEVQKAIGAAIDARLRAGLVESRASLAMLSAFLIVCVVFAGLSFWMVRARLARPLRILSAGMTKMAAGDYSVAIAVAHRNDEVGEMAKAVEVFKRGGLENARLRAEQEELGRKSEAQRRAMMQDMAGRFESQFSEALVVLARAADDLRGEANVMSTTAEQTSVRAVGVAAGAEEMSKSVQSVAAAANELHASIEDVTRQVGSSAQKTKTATEDVRRTQSDVLSLSQAVTRIGSVVELIQHIATQTNLLALNATIEAARAGQAGRGFAVVAHEVKDLATQTSKATDDIIAQIGAMVDASQTVVTAVERIGSSIADMDEAAIAIARAADGQAAATGEISHVIATAAQGANDVSRNIADVGEGAKSAGTAAGHVLAAATSLSEQAARMREHVATFILQVRAS